MVYNTQNHCVCEISPQNSKNVTPRKLDLFPPSGEGREAPTWVL
jgi:hypothetical protein